MNKNIARILCLALGVAPVAAFAAKNDGPKAKLAAKYDLNHDGKLDADEMAALRKDFAAAPDGDLKRFDQDKDGKLSDEEIVQSMPGSGRKHSKKTEKKAEAETPTAATPPTPSDTPVKK